VTTVLVEDIGVLVHGDSTSRRCATPRSSSRMVSSPASESATRTRSRTFGGRADVIPGLVDGQVHPTFGEWTPAQNSIGWIHNYLHGGTTSMVSAVNCTSRPGLRRTDPRARTEHRDHVQAHDGADAAFWRQGQRRHDTSGPRHDRRALRRAARRHRPGEVHLLRLERLGDGEAQRYVVGRTNAE